MGCNSFDLTIEEALADPVIAATMRADKVEPRHVEDLLRGLARERGVVARGPAISVPPSRPVRGALCGLMPW